MADAYFGLTMLFVICIPMALLYYAIKRSTFISQQEQKFWGKEILLVIAHPGDEAKLFVPAILQLSAYNTVTVLCVCNGSRTGSGLVREKELQQSCESLDIEPPTVLNVDKLKES